MNGLLSDAHYYMFHLWDLYGDPHVKNYFINRYGAYFPTLILLSYYLFVTKVGPKFMKSREAFNLKWTLLVYNTCLVFINIYFFVKFLLTYNYGLDIFDFEYQREDQFSETEIAKTTLAQWYLLSKFLDLLDTIFFVLRKKQNQVTKMHLYHHISVPGLGWLVFRWANLKPPLVIFCIINSLIHSIMYSYYALAAFGPSIQPYLWWKKYVTLLQIYQFVIYSAFSLLFAVKQTGYPPYLQFLAYTQPTLFLVLFVRFYRSSYKRSKIPKEIKLKD